MYFPVSRPPATGIHVVIELYQGYDISRKHPGREKRLSGKIGKVRKLKFEKALIQSFGPVFFEGKQKF